MRKMRSATAFKSNAKNIFLRMFMDRSDNRILRKKFGDDMPSVAELSKKLSVILVNTHYSLSGPRAFSPKVIEVGGVHIKEPKAIDEVSDNKSFCS